MLLAIDVGNTQTVLGVYDGADLRHMWRVATNKTHTADELRLKLMLLLESENINTDEIHASALASVVPYLTREWGEALSYLLKKEVLVCSPETAAKLFKTDYPNPAEIGSDRIADAVAASALYGTPVVVVDFGTATNIEVIDKEGKFLGGIIAPGLETSAAALFQHATRLAATELEDPHEVIGTSTRRAIQSGIVYGEAARVDGLVLRAFDAIGYTAPVVATGGLCQKVAPLSQTITHTNQELTLEGLRLIYEAQ
ncbi:MAG: type III pantothenate kinase [Eggerthellaceae bacterium]|jgi:type III pantothenate kinase